MPIRPIGGLLALGIHLVACAPNTPIHTSEGVTMRSVRLSAATSAPDPATVDAHGYLGFDLLATSNAGVPYACDPSTVELQMEVSYDDGATWVAVDPAGVEVQCATSPSSTVALVLDNSGSQLDVLDATQVGATRLVDETVARGGRLSVTRVSTGAAVLVDTTDDSTTLNDEIDGLFVNKGWTALYDGMRMGHETLGKAVHGDHRFSSATHHCERSDRPALVAFTNGVDNNSASERSPLYADGIDTSFDDLLGLQIDGVTTPIFSIGLGDVPNHDLLTELAERSGGKHLTVAEAEALPSAFDLIGEYETETLEVCAPLNVDGCGGALVRVGYTFGTEDGEFSDTFEYSVDVPCPELPQHGRTVVILLTMTNPGIDAELAGTLARNAVDYTSPTDTPAILVVRDDNHHNEFKGDPQAIAELLDDAGYDVDFTDEPDDGLSADMLEGYDVVWFSNPGYPIDDAASLDALDDHLANGGGVVLQGDDMSWSWGGGFSMSPWTHLDHASNGTTTCGARTDNNDGESFAVLINDDVHPLIAGIQGTEFLYADDIDHTSPRNEGEVVLAWATLDGDDDCDVNVPVLVTYDPE